MLGELNFSEARKQFTHFFNQVHDEAKPYVIRRHQHEEVIALRLDLQKLALTCLCFQPEILPEDDGTVTLALDVLDMAVNAATIEEAKQELTADLIDYARDYVERAVLFLASPNRRHHFPHVLRILLCEDAAEVRQLLE